MTKFTELDDGTTLKEEFYEIGWSIFDSYTIYRVIVTNFSIPDGIISVNIRYANKDGSAYQAKWYRNHFNGFTEI